MSRTKYIGKVTADHTEEVTITFEDIYGTKKGSDKMTFERKAGEGFLFHSRARLLAWIAENPSCRAIDNNGVFYN